MNVTTTNFHREFASALHASHADFHDNIAHHFFAAQPGFSVYRNTVVKGWIDALQGNFPAVARLVGEEWFRAAAAVFATDAPPTDARLLLYGAAFPAFLEGFPPANELPHLSGVAELDRLWTLAHLAIDEPAVSADSITALAGADLSRVNLQPRQSAHWHHHATQPIFSLWHANRFAENDATIDLSDIATRGEGAIVLRPDQAVTSHPCDSATIAFLDACRDGQTITHAAASALAVAPESELQHIIATLFQIDAFAAIRFL